MSYKILVTKHLSPYLHTTQSNLVNKYPLT